MEINTAIQKFKEIESKIHAYNHAMGLIGYDAVTYGPTGAYVGRGKTLEVLSDALYSIMTNPETKEVTNCLLSNKDQLDEVTRRSAELFNESNEYTSSIPQDEYLEYQVLLNESAVVWRKAKEENDFASFAPYLEKVVNSNIKFAKYYKPTEDAMNTLLGLYEKGLTRAELDNFFNSLREKIVPLIAKIGKAQQIDDSFLHQHFPLEKQREFSDYLMGLMNIDRRYCTIGETEHPFTQDFNKYDVRITTHYYENDLTNSMYSVIHESGHATYELNGGDEYQGTFVAGGVSMGMHESQSRFFENYVGRSEEFCNYIFPKVCELFPEQMKGKTAYDFYLGVNKSEPSLIRMQADELTYPLHILVRYEIEKALVDGKASVYDLPKLWAEKYKEYLGIDVPDDSRGVLQDSHWSNGQFGYFPTYALGSAYGAQFLSEMNEDFDVKATIAKGDLAPIISWFRERLYHDASLYDSKQTFEKVASGKFNPDYFVKYLEEKYSKIYNL